MQEHFTRDAFTGGHRSRVLTSLSIVMEVELVIVTTLVVVAAQLEAHDVVTKLKREVVLV